MERLQGSATSVLPSGISHLDPPSAVFAAMLEGWATQQRTRFLKTSTVRTRLDLVRRFAEFSNEYPWQWQPAEVEAFFDALRSGDRPLAVSTARNYQNTLRMFCDYIVDARYGWVTECVDRFGAAPVQILHEWNTITHVSEYEGQPDRRPLTYEEVQALFDAADGRAEQIRTRGRKGALAALRDAALLKTVYGYGLRRQEVVGLDLADLRSNPASVRYGRFGALFVRFGKSSKGCMPYPKRRLVRLGLFRLLSSIVGAVVSLPIGTRVGPSGTGNADESDFGAPVESRPAKRRPVVIISEQGVHRERAGDRDCTASWRPTPAVWHCGTTHSAVAALARDSVVNVLAVTTRNMTTPPSRPVASWSAGCVG